MACHESSLVFRHGKVNCQRLNHGTPNLQSEHREAIERFAKALRITTQAGEYGTQGREELAPSALARRLSGQLPDLALDRA
jgi:hypothetical protein